MNGTNNTSNGHSPDSGIDESLDKLAAKAINLRPCPFDHHQVCSGREISTKLQVEYDDNNPDSNVYWIECYGCGARGPCGSTTQEATLFWGAIE